MDRISVLAELHAMLRKMEVDVGLDRLTPAEMDVFLAAHSIAGEAREEVTSDRIREHALVADLAQATYYRALRSLVSAGLLEKAKGHKARHYIVRSDLVS